jgi:hypothetical protein
MMLEILGLVFGGASRLVQHWMDLKDKDKERDHEHRMTVVQVELQDKRLAHDAEMRRADAQAAESASEWDALKVAVASQTAEARAAGGWVAKFSAVMRPLLTFYHCIIMYTVHKCALFYLAMMANMTWATAFVAIYGDFDRGIVGSIIGYWFMDRGLRKK